MVWHSNVSIDPHLSATQTDDELVPGELPGRGLQVEVLEAGGVVRGRLQVVLQFSTVQYSTVQYGTLEYSTVLYSKTVHLHRHRDGEKVHLAVAGRQVPAPPIAPPAAPPLHRPPAAVAPHQHQGSHQNHQTHLGTTI